MNPRNFLKWNRISLFAVMVFLAIITVMFYLKPELAATFATLLFFTPAFVLAVVLLVSVVYELIRTGSVNFKSKDLGLDTPLTWKEVSTHGNRGQQEQTEQSAE